MNPKHRTNNLVIQETETELLIYDLTENKAFCLNESSSIIWQSCDGQKSFEEIAKQTQIPQEFVWVAIEEFNKSNLLADKMTTPLPKDNQSRRKVLLKLATTAIALPFMTSIIAPRAIHAASGSCVGLGTKPLGFVLFESCEAGSACIQICMGLGDQQCCSGWAETGLLSCPNCSCTCVESSDNFG